MITKIKECFVKVFTPKVGEFEEYMLAFAHNEARRRLCDTVAVEYEIHGNHVIISTEDSLNPDVSAKNTTIVPIDMFRTRYDLTKDLNHIADLYLGKVLVLLGEKRWLKCNNTKRTNRLN